ncbi:MAG: MFS transporter [Chloroflexi bacterium]|nr:MFS transporter [Chloroflexota bacterium]
MNQVETPAAGTAPATAHAPSRAGLVGRIGALRSLKYPAFRRAMFAFLFVATGNWMERLVVGWYVHHETGSVFLTAASFAARSAPSVLFGPIGGAFADRFDRRRILIATVGAKASIYVVLAGWTLFGDGSIWPVFALVAMAGVTSTFEVPSSQALITDIVDRQDAMNAISLNSFGMRAVGVFGAMIGGAMLEVLRPGWVFLAAAGFLATALLTFLSLNAGVTRARSTVGSILANTVQGIRAMVGIPVVATLLTVAMVVEILGFAYQSVMPVVADDVLDVGPAGLGALTLMAGVGGVAGVALLSTLGDYRRKGLLVVFVTAGFGGFLIALAASTVFPLSLAVVVGIGAMAGMFDALQWIVLQASVPGEMRGRVIGGGIFAIGFGWAGHLALGGIGQALGVQWALAASGLALVTLGLSLLLFARRLRRA